MAEPTIPTAELESQASELRQLAWLAGEAFKAFKDSGLPEQLSSDLVYAWWVGPVDD